MRALWLVRKNLNTRPGGDTTQILRTQEALEQRGVSVTLCSDRLPPYDSHDVVHLFHLDRIWENMRWVDQIQSRQVPAVLSPIYWPTHEYDQLGRKGFQGVLSRNLGPMHYAGLRALQHAGLSALKQKDASLVQFNLFHFKAHVQKILNSVDLLLPNSLSEQIQIEDYFGPETKSLVVPNAADLSTFRLAPKQCGQRSKKVICVGRIEPRKNQLALIRALSGTSTQLAIVGEPGRFGHGYARRCYKEAGPNVTFHRWQPARALARYYSEAQVHACPSWYETPGLASLEAAASGCHLVLTDRGATREYFGEEADYCDPNDTDSIRDAIQKALTRETPPSLWDKVSETYTWKQTGQRTQNAYATVLGSSN